MPPAEPPAASVNVLQLLKDAVPAHWHKAPLPGAPLCLARPDGLHGLGPCPPPAVAPAVLKALSAPGVAGETLTAKDSSGQVWRLRRCGAAGVDPCWQLQALDDSRGRLLTALRGLLGPRLSECVLHELRNPLNALSLHADLLSRLLRAAELQKDRLTTSADTIKQRLGEMSRRQNAAVTLWLENPAADAAPLAVEALVEASLRLARGHLSAQDLRLHTDDLPLLAGLNLPGCHAAALQLALLAALQIGAAGTLRAGANELTVRASLIDARPGLELHAALDGQALARELADTDQDGLLAALALLLEPAGVGVELRSQAVLRFEFREG